MRIAQIAPLVESVPPKMYGGTERVISSLTEELVKRGHKVTLFASGDSKTSAKLVSVHPNSLRSANIKNVYGTNIWTLLNIGLAYQEQDKFDIIHDHNSQNNPISLPLANLSNTPVVMTLHGTLNGDYGFNKNGESFEMFEFYNRPHLVTISKAQRKPAPHLNFIGNVYHGLRMDDYPFFKRHDGYLLFVGRVHLYKGAEEKGLLTAIKVAKLLDMPLLIAAKVDQNSPEDVGYYKQMIKPHLSEHIQFFGEVDDEMRNELMSHAYCVLHPVNFAEPFGLTLIESMACGTPLVAFNKGSIPEVIQDGKTGFIVNDIAGMVKAVKKVGDLDRSYCRSYALSNFSAEKMAEGYEEIYEKILTKKIRKTSEEISASEKVGPLRKPTSNKYADL